MQSDPVLRCLLAIIYDYKPTQSTKMRQSCASKRKDLVDVASDKPTSTAEGSQRSCSIACFPSPYSSFDTHLPLAIRAPVLDDIDRTVPDDHHRVERTGVHTRDRS